MSITDELRKVAAKTECANGRCEKLYRGDLEHIADRIDAEHEDQLLGERNIAYNAGYDEGFASADDWLGQHEDAMAEHGWVKLPVDADGEYIRIGDVMDKGKVTCIRDCGKGWEVILNSLYTYDAPSLHHHEPTVEDVLCELLDKVDDDRAGQAEIIAEYAAKLRLAKEDE